MRLYVFDRDVAGNAKSACNGPSAANWPPLVVGPDSPAVDQYTIVARDDGMRPWAYTGRPRYPWSKDQKPGDRTGDKVNNVWRVATA